MDPRESATADPLAFQVRCARPLHDYWQRLETIMATFASSRLEERRRGLLARLFSALRRSESPR